MSERVLVIGGAGAIGSAIARKYLSAGYEVVIADLDDKGAARLLGETVGGLSFVHLDVLESDSLVAFGDHLRTRFESLTHVVSVAGGALLAEHSAIEDCPIEVISESIDLNLKSHTYLIKVLLPLIQPGSTGATITLISSINAVRCFGLPAYSAAKAGLLGLVVSLVAELGAKGIRINAVLPGTVPTPRTLKLPKDFKQLERQTALGRFTTPSEIGNVVFSLTELMTCVTGQGIVADCGQVAMGTMA
jgi:NAD(P)-dependent dehydrogenase (short-subunit alcohol dehydrogenase family)